MADRHYRIIRKVEETPNAISIFLKADDDAPLDPFYAGQHLTFDIPGVGERDYALSAFSLQPKLYRITIIHGNEEHNTARHASSFWLRFASSGDVLKASGPSGAFHLPSKLNRPIVILSKGIGEAILTAIAEELAIKAPRQHAVFLHSTFNSSTFALKGKLASLKADLPQASWKVWFSDPRQIDRQGKEYDLCGELEVSKCGALFPQKEFDAYICGPDDFATSTEAALRSLKSYCRQLFRESMGADIDPPIEIAQELKLPPLEPRTVRFVRSGKQATWAPERGTLLEFAEYLGIQAPFSCRTGMCGTCAQKMISGQVAKIRETSAKTNDECQLLCSNIPVSDLEIDL